MKVYCFLSTILFRKCGARILILDSNLEIVGILGCDSDSRWYCRFRPIYFFMLGKLVERRIQTILLLPFMFIHILIFELAYNNKTHLVVILNFVF